MATPAPASRLAIVALALGVLCMLMLIGGIIWASAAEAEAVFAPMLFSAVPIAIVGLGGGVVAIVALANRAQPRWFGVVGLILSAIPHTIAIAALIQLMMIFAFLDAQTYEL